MFKVEFMIRNKAKDMPRCYFLTLFACCRESYIEGGKNFGISDIYKEEEEATEN